MCGWFIISAIRGGTDVLMAESTLVTVLGGLAAALTSLAYLPQVKKAWPRGSTEDLSWKMLSALTAGLALWIIYGLAKGDWVIVACKRGGGNALGYRVGLQDPRHDVERRGLASGWAHRSIVWQLSIA